jgi:hypothetical protein
MAIEGLRSEGHRTAEAEKSHEKFKSLHQGLLQKLAALQREETVTKPARVSFSRRRLATLRRATIAVSFEVVGFGGRRSLSAYARQRTAMLAIASSAPQNGFLGSSSSIHSAAGAPDSRSSWRTTTLFCCSVMSTEVRMTVSPVLRFLISIEY